MTFFLTKDALNDLKNIARYTEKTWGKPQRVRYLSQIDECFQQLSKHPYQGQSCEQIRPGYRKHLINRHIIFYRSLQQEDAIEIVRILHERMEIEILLK